MRTHTLALALALALCQAQALRADTGKPNEVPGLTIDPPSTRTRPGYTKVGAITAATEVGWDVEADFDLKDGEDPGVIDFQWEVLSPKQILVSIPDRKGLIRITAVALADGHLTKLAKTTIEVSPGAIDPSPAPAPQPKPPAPQPTPTPTPTPAPQGKASTAFFVIDQDRGDPAVAALVTSADFRNAVAKAGVRPRVLPSTSQAVAKVPGLADAVKAAGLPAMVTLDAQGKVLWKGRIPATADQVLAQLGGK